MTTAAVVEQLLHAPVTSRPRLLSSLASHLSLALVIALKQRVDAEKLRNARRALEIAEITQAVAATLAQPEAQAWALWARGNALHHLANHQEALTCYQQAEAYFAKQARWGVSLETTILQVNQVAARLELGDFRTALALAAHTRTHWPWRWKPRPFASRRPYRGVRSWAWKCRTAKPPSSPYAA